jgi:hypothetical protein
MAKDDEIAKLATVYSRGKIINNNQNKSYAQDKVFAAHDNVVKPCLHDVGILRQGAVL